MSVTVCFVTGGWAHVSSEHGVMGYRFAAGDVFYLCDWASYQLGWSDGLEMLTVEVPVKVIESYGPHVDADRMSFAQRSALIPPVRNFIEALPDGTEISVVAEYALGQLVEEMIGALFLEASGVVAPSWGSRPVLFQQALALITAKRSLPDLSAQSIARELAVSVRRLQRCFQDHDTTVTAQIRRLRVELASSLLQDPRYLPLSIADIAAHSGFDKPSDLRRALRVEGHRSPSSLRAPRLGGDQITPTMVTSAPI